MNYSHPKKSHTKKPLQSALLTVIFSFIFFASSFSVAQSFDRDILEDIFQTVVRVLPLDPRSGNPLGSLGSGTIISPEGYILTNYHVVSEPRGNSFTNAFDFARIDISPNARSEPTPTYIAEFVDGDKSLDLALLKIVGDAKGNRLPASSSYPFMPIGDSDDVLITEELQIFGYPGFSGRTLTATEGIVSGFLAEDGKRGGEDWIKTDAKISPGNSGGAAFNENGELVGIPTLLFSDARLAVAEGRLRPVRKAFNLLQRNRVPGIQVGRIAPGTAPSANNAPNNGLPAAPATTQEENNARQAQIDQAMEAAISAYDAGNYAAALELFGPLAQLDQTLAYTYLGVMYANGDGVPQNYATSYQFYQKAASRGDVNALNNVASLLEDGLGVERNLERAVQLYAVAAQLGHQNALDSLRRLGIASPVAPDTSSSSDANRNATIAPNFQPDPISIEYAAGGNVETAKAFGASCTAGFIANTPDHVITVTQDFDYLRFVVQSDADTTMVIQDTSDNSVACVDDTEGYGQNPAIVFSRGLPAGTYNIYVGNYTAQQQSPYTFYITEYPER